MDIISWPVLTLITLVLWVVSILIDKYMLNNVKDPMIFWAFASFVSLVTAVIVWVIIGINIQPNLALIAIGTGTLSILGAWTYYRTIGAEEVSRIFPVMKISIPMTILLSAVFLGEIFNLVTYVGIALLIAGALILSARFDTKLHRLVHSPAIPYVIGGAILAASTTVIRKWLLLQVDWLQLLAFGSLGTWLAFMTLLYYRRSEISGVLRQRSWLIWGIISTVLTVAGVVTITLAYSLGTASLVSALSSAEPAMLFIAAVAISIWWPKILREELHGSTIIIKAIATILVVIGSILVIS